MGYLSFCSFFFDAAFFVKHNDFGFESSYFHSRYISLFLQQAIQYINLRIDEKFDLGSIYQSFQNLQGRYKLVSVL